MFSLQIFLLKFIVLDKKVYETARYRLAMNAPCDSYIHIQACALSLYVITYSIAVTTLLV